MGQEPLNTENVPVFILAGGLGTRMGSETVAQPKPMVTIGDKPVIWHIMRKYRSHGFRKFIVCAGYKAEVIKDYFLNYSALNSDFTVDLGNGGLEIHAQNHDDDWEVTVADTGLDVEGGARIARAAERYLGLAEHFAVTYGDGLTDADLGAELEMHQRLGAMGTVLGVNFPSRFGEFAFDPAGDGQFASGFIEKPSLENSWVNGGYFFFDDDFLDLLDTDPKCVLERRPLQTIADAGSLAVYRHHGFWQCMDTQRERDVLERMWREGKAPWRPK